MSEKTFEKKLKNFVDDGIYTKNDGGYYFKYDGYGYFVKCNFVGSGFLIFAWIKKKKYNNELGKYVETGENLYDFIQGGDDINYVFEFLKNYEGKYW